VLDGGVIMASGVQDFTKRRGESNGIMFLRFHKWIADLTSLGLPDLIQYEQAHMRGGAAAEICIGLQTHTQSFAASHNINCSGVHTATVKKFAAGSAKAQKGKEQSIAFAAKVLGRAPMDDNEADAVVIALWAYREFDPTSNEH
jgi:Holliday junction resolvasome RuvABC endonuclease subunit